METWKPVSLFGLSYFSLKFYSTYLKNMDILRAFGKALITKKYQQKTKKAAAY